MTKIDKTVFDWLSREKSKHEKAVFAAETAISSLQALCEHQWKTSPNHGYGADDVYCEICGLDKDDLKEETP